MIDRFAYLPFCTLGWLTCASLRLATIERPWLPNPHGPGGKPSLSCVPDGEYKLIPHTSQRFPNTYALISEPLGVYYQQRPAGQAWGRTAILIHVGNFVADVIGCIAVGLRHGADCVTNSRDAMDQLRAALGREQHGLTIRPQGTGR